MIEVENVNAGYFQAAVLRDVSLKVEAGECACLVGANGAGKSTLLGVISGLVKPTAGKVTFEGTNLIGLSAAEIVEMGVIQVPEGRRLFPKMTVMDNLLLGARNKRAKRDLNAGFEKVYSLFPVLAERKQQQAGTLSGGQQQMLAIARGLMAKPKILLLDEPSIGLSPLLVREIFKIVKELVKQGIPVLLVEQNVRAALGISQHGFLIERGKIVLSGESKVLAEESLVKMKYIGG